jgi:hypothetical protein
MATAKRPRKKVHEWGQNFLVNVPVDLSEYFEYGTPGDGSFFENYVGLRRDIHVHGSARVNGANGAPTKFCAVYHLRADALDEHLLDVEIVSSDAQASELRDGEMEQPVPINAGQLVELPQRIVGKAIPSLMRLQLLDDCRSVWAERPDLSPAFVVAHRPVPEDRELDFLRDIGWQGPRMRFRQGVGQVIEGGSHDEERVSQDEREDSGGFVGLQPHDLAGANWLRFKDHAVAIRCVPGCNLIFEYLELMLRPRELQFVTTHALTSSWMPAKKQKTRPKKGKPIEIPVPKREDFERMVRRSATRRPSK